MEHNFTEDKSVSGVGNELQVRRRAPWTVALAVAVFVVWLYLEGRLTDPVTGRSFEFLLRSLTVLAASYAVVCLVNVAAIAFQGSRLDDQIYGFVGAAMTAGGLVLFERRLLDVAVHVEGSSVDVRADELPVPEAAAVAALLALGLVLAWKG